MLKIRKLIFASALFLILPVLVVKADPTHSLEFSCVDTVITPQQSTTCTIKVNVLDSSVRVVSFGARVSVTESDGTTSSQKLSLSDYTYNNTNWNGTMNVIEDDEYTLTRSASSEPLTGLIEIGTFKITAGQSTGIVRVNLSNVMVGNKFDTNEPAQELTDPGSAYVDINITNSESTGSDENTNSNSGENNNSSGTETNTGENNSGSTETKTDDKKAEDKKTENPVNPKTGVKVSLIGFAMLVVGGVSYIVLRKKNYFNRI